MKSTHERKQARGTVTRGSDNVFVDLGYRRRVASDLKIRADLALAVYERIQELGLGQKEAGEYTNLSQPDISKLVRGRHSGLSIERLVCALSALGADVDIILTPKPALRRRGLCVVRVVKRNAAKTFGK